MPNPGTFIAFSGDDPEKTKEEFDKVVKDLAGTKAVFAKGVAKFPERIFRDDAKKEFKEIKRFYKMRSKYKKK